MKPRLKQASLSRKPGSRLHPTRVPAALQPPLPTTESGEPAAQPAHREPWSGGGSSWKHQASFTSQVKTEDKRAACWGLEGPEPEEEGSLMPCQTPPSQRALLPPGMSPQRVRRGYVMPPGCKERGFCGFIVGGGGRGECRMASGEGQAQT